MQEKIAAIEKELETIKARNRRVEADKAWEISGLRIGTILVITYITAATVLFIIGVKDYYLGALVPALGFLLSTQSLPLIKNWWIKRRLSK